MISVVDGATQHLFSSVLLPWEGSPINEGRFLNSTMVTLEACWSVDLFSPCRRCVKTASLQFHCVNPAPPTPQQLLSKLDTLFWWCETGHVSAVRTYTHMLTQSEVCLRLLSSHSPLVSKTNIHFSVSLLAMAGPRPVVFSGPSGAGKSTLLKKLMKEYDSVFGFSVSRKCVTFRAGRRAPVGLWGQWM